MHMSSWVQFNRQLWGTKEEGETIHCPRSMVNTLDGRKIGLGRLYFAQQTWFYHCDKKLYIATQMNCMLQCSVIATYLWHKPSIDSEDMVRNMWNVKNETVASSLHGFFKTLCAMLIATDIILKYITWRSQEDKW